MRVALGFEAADLGGDGLEERALGSELAHHGLGLAVGLDQRPVVAGERLLGRLLVAAGVQLVEAQPLGLLALGPGRQRGVLDQARSLSGVALALAKPSSACWLRRRYSSLDSGSWILSVVWRAFAARTRSSKNGCVCQ